MHLTPSGFRLGAVAAFAIGGFLSLNGCGNTYRPVVAAINPVGPSAQPQKFAVAISNPGPGLPGLVTIVDFSGDTVLDTTAIGVSPQYLILGGGGTTGYTVNGDGTLNTFGISTSLIASQVTETTLLSGATPVPSIFPQGASTYVVEQGRNAIAQFTGSPLALRQEITVTNPVYVVGLTNAPRIYALGQGTGSGASATNGQAIAIDTASNTPTAALPVGKTPVYGVMTSDGKRAFVLNQGDGTVSVINAQTNALDVSALIPKSTIAVGTAPLWADFAPSLSEMVVANAGNGTTAGSLSIVSIPLCSAAALVTNPNCDATNPVDAVGFGTVLANVPVGINPVMVSVLQDGTRAYVANAGNPNLPCATVGSDGVTPTATPTGNCSVSVVNLTSNTVTATIPIAGRPAYIAATTGTPTGKVYVICNNDPKVASGVLDPNARYMTVLRTDIDTVALTIPLQGSGVAVRVTAQ